MEQLAGTGVALITPFNEDFSIDTQALSKVVHYCIDGGVDYLVVLGTTGETAVLSKKEKQLVINTVVAANEGRLPLVLGIGSNNTAAVVEELQEVDLKEFVAILSVSPYYSRPTQEGIYQHFKAISLASPKPILLYNVPGRTGSNMLPETVLRLASDFNNIIGIKEASGDMVQVMRLIKDKPSDFMIISGDDFTALPTVLAGGDGVISVLGQGLPTEFSRMIRYGLENKVKEAFNLHYALMEGMDLIFKEGNPAGIKAMLEHMGIGTAVVRLPLVEATASLKKSISRFLSSVLKIVA
ncbi:4-hydroxy-tetrahydrodipicolinate synthase [Arenibacter certesii]|uniref:4-hydroxy-tetrahydrodipicolinate synthase n=1 Tax=Arenibacter certesii TaxID=228955 RepID=A0A918J1V7_9FLAO|nr:4-hydroxy-tetrahydrodipicolinate synthase [Arenibacter certesii]GGW43118.1 4-hydroxy-tetrahydrodipicolinate synthase [Arenibacter certesii]